jgi:ubiquinone/menaquinone biosynthesis C-methylase UbiE
MYVIAKEGSSSTGEEYMANKFDPENMAKLESEEREQFFSAGEILVRMDVKEGDIIADIGCGIGYLSLPAAQVVGESGHIYALDTSDRMLEELKNRIEREGVSNVTALLSSEYEFPLEPASCTHVVMSMVFHEVDDRVRFAKAAAPVLKPGGKLVVFEMIPGAGGLGPPEHHRISMEEVISAFEEAGFSVVSKAEMNEFIYYVIGRE